VRTWITLNEQNHNLINAYRLGTHPPAVQDEKRFYAANHNAFLANAAAILAFRRLVPEGRIGPSFAYSPAYPASSDPRDMLAFENAEDFMNAWWLDAYCLGRYPGAALAHLREIGFAPDIRDGDMETMARARPDFLGVNYYFSVTYAANALDGATPQRINTTGEKGTTPVSGLPGLFRTAPNPHLATTDWDWAVDPVGLRVGLRRLFSRYDLPLLITENGLGAFDRLEDERVHDGARIAYLRDHLSACKAALADGVSLMGYCVWSFTDVLSWLNGYQKRYGLVYVNRDENDPRDLRRVRKDSFAWYAETIRQNGANLP
jgi:6-phospho-beta-glucosidase